MPYGALPYGRGQYALRLPTFVALPILCATTTYTPADAATTTTSAGAATSSQHASADTTTTPAAAEGTTVHASAVTAWGCCAS